MEQNRPHNTPAASRRQQQIEDCLFQAMLRFPYEKISVLELCRQVGISRRTFYTYFRRKDDCLDAIMDRIIRDSVLCLPKGGELDRVAVVYLTFWKAQAPFLDMIAKQSLVSRFRDRCILFFQDEDPWFFLPSEVPQIYRDEDLLRVYVSLRVGLILQWHARGFDTPVEDMAAKFIRIFREPILRS